MIFVTHKTAERGIKKNKINTFTYIEEIAFINCDKNKKLADHAPQRMTRGKKGIHSIELNKYVTLIFTN